MVFLYFYGLERRLIGERAVEDRADIVAEVERLRGVYGANRSFSRYSEELLAAARIPVVDGQFDLVLVLPRRPQPSADFAPGRDVEPQR